ncbi:MAG: hypothetical protein ACK4VO_06775 [Pseudobdellovibrio sp.]
MHNTNQTDSVLKIINSKLIPFAEVVVCLFENCNLSCVFCPQNHKSTIGMSKNEILSKIPIIENFINQIHSSDIHLHIMGGELFQDHLIEEGFLDYYSMFIDILQSKFRESNKKLIFNFISNLTFKKSSDVLHFLKKHDLQISLSYDPSGRFNKNSLELFKKNLILFSENIRMVSCVLTSPNINKVISGDTLFDEIYKKFPIDWDSLIPSLENSQSLMPKESELLKFYKFLVDYYPECINLENFFDDKNEQSMRCTRGRSLTIMPNNQIPTGCSGAIFLRDSKSNDPSSNIIIENFLTKYNCLSCEFYSRCPFTCFIKQDYQNLIHDVDGCVYQETFKYIKTKKNTNHTDRSGEFNEHKH